MIKKNKRYGSEHLFHYSGLTLDILIWIKNGEMKKKLQENLSDIKMRKLISERLIFLIKEKVIHLDDNLNYKIIEKK